MEENTTTGPKFRPIKIQTLKNRRAHGIISLPNKLIKYRRKKLSQKIRILFKRVISTEEVLEEWTRSTTVSLLTKGDKKDLANYRTVS